MAEDSDIRLIDLVICLSDAMDFIDPEVVNHHKQVAYIAFSIGAEMGLPFSLQNDLLLGGALHDIGAFSLKERKDILKFEMKNSHEHAEAGYALLRLFQPLGGIASIIRFHHTRWDDGRGSESEGEAVHVASHILHLADRVAVLIDKGQEILGQVPAITDKIRRAEGVMFVPEVVGAFMNLVAKEFFWLDIVSPSIRIVLADKLGGASFKISSEDIQGFARLFSRIIDFKSPFTATHSSGVAVCSEMLAGLVGFSEKERSMMRISGYLHDLGKLAVPVEILDKPAKLRAEEVNVVRHHTFYTFRILETIPSLNIINRWAAFHHERLDGSGYPFHLKADALPFGSQIMAVADIFTALMENRPYRGGMTRDGVINILDNMAGDSFINKEIVGALKLNYDDINNARIQAQAEAVREYEGVRQTVMKTIV